MFWLTVLEKTVSSCEHGRREPVMAVSNKAGERIKDGAQGSPGYKRHPTFLSGL